MPVKEMVLDLRTTSIQSAAQGKAEQSVPSELVVPKIPASGPSVLVGAMLAIRSSLSAREGSCSTSNVLNCGSRLPSSLTNSALGISVDSLPGV